MKLGELIRAKRHASGLTQRKLAEISKVNHVQICKYERGQVRPTLAVMERISQKLDIPEKQYQKYFLAPKDTSIEELEDIFKQFLNSNPPVEDINALHLICISLLGHIGKKTLQQQQKAVLQISFNLE